MTQNSPGDSKIQLDVVASSTVESHGDSQRALSPDDEQTVGESAIYISQASKMIGVSAATIRAWEKEGLITPKRSPSGYRTYGGADLDRLARIRDLTQMHNFNVSAIRHELDRASLAEPPGRRPAELPPRPSGFRHPVYYMRKRAGMTLRALASSTGLSASALSAVERRVSTPSVETLRRLAAAFDTTVPELLGVAPADDVVVHSHQRQEMDLGIPGVVYQSLFSRSVSLQSMLIVFEPGAGSDESYAHEGEEFLYVVQGELELVLEDGQQLRLVAGDAATYLSTRPHRLRNVGTGSTEVLWVQTPPSL